MRFAARFVLAVSFLAVVATGPLASRAAGQRATQRENQWRYTFHNDEWWYWLPSNRWVYWRNSEWKNYDPKTYAWPISPDAAARTQARSAYGSQAADGSDNRPFYGHALSDSDQRPMVENGEVGPFYGRALPREYFGPWRSRSANRPFYGHAVSSYD